MTSLDQRPRLATVETLEEYLAEPPGLQRRSEQRRWQWLRNEPRASARRRERGSSAGDYYFLMDLEVHLSDEVVADCLRALKIKQAPVKFFGSYPAAGEHDHDRPRLRLIDLTKERCRLNRLAIPG